jgi:tRNA (guanine-N7-)-methyltransferase
MSQNGCIRILTGQYGVIDPWWGRPACPIELDMGCGKGGFALQLAERFPQRLVLASDVMLGRLRKLARHIETRNLPNVEVLRTNSLDLVGYQLPDACIRRLHLLCPDPWPKDRHRARRIVTTDFLVRVARVLVPGGVFHFATDDIEYVDAVREIIRSVPPLQPDDPLDGIVDIRDIQTDFERRWHRLGRDVQHIACVARP